MGGQNELSTFDPLPYALNCAERMAGLDELPQLYKELRLLRLKYEHLADVCKSLMKNWSVGMCRSPKKGCLHGYLPLSSSPCRPNRNSDGRLVKTVPKKTAATGQAERGKLII